MQREPATSARRVLVIRLGQLGDLVLCLPALTEAQRRDPGLQVVFLTRRAWSGLLECAGLVHTVHYLEDLAAPHQFWHWLQGLQIDEVWELQGTFRARVIGWMAAFVSGARLRSPERKRLERQALLQHSGLGMVARGLMMLLRRRHLGNGQERQWQRSLELVWEALPKRYLDHNGVSCPDEERTEHCFEAHAWSLQEREHPERSGTALLPGARHPTKRWPLKHWQALAEALDARGEPLFLLGGPEEDVLLQTLNQAVPSAARVQGDWQVLLKCLKARRVAIGQDSALSHLAESVGTPVLMLMGPTVPAFGFAPSLPGSQVLELPLPCRPCSLHGGSVCPLGHHGCLEQLEPERVVSAWGTQSGSSMV